MDEDRSLAQLLALLLALLQSSNVEDDGGPSKCRQRPCASVTQERGQCPQEGAAHTSCVAVNVRVCVFVFVCVHDCFTQERRAYTVCVLLFLYFSFLFLFHVIYFSSTGVTQGHE